MAQVFSCEFCEIVENSFFTEHLWTTAFKNEVTGNYSANFTPVNNLFYFIDILLFVKLQLFEFHVSNHSHKNGRNFFRSYDDVVTFEFQLFR